MIQNPESVHEPAIMRWMLNVEQCVNDSEITPKSFHVYASASVDRIQFAIVFGWLVGIRQCVHCAYNVLLH